MSTSMKYAPNKKDYHNNKEPNAASQKKKTVVIISGPTGVGKTKVASLLKGALISADSVQVYKEVEIGANKPSAEELGHHPHLLLDFVPLSSSYNAAEWTQDAHYCIRYLLNLKQTDDCSSFLKSTSLLLQKVKSASNEHTNTTTPIVVGGTMMYLQWLVHGVPDAMRPSSSALEQAQQDITQFQNTDDWDNAVAHVESFGFVYKQQIQQTLCGKDWYRLRRILEVAYTAQEQQLQDDVAAEVFRGVRQGGLLSDPDIDLRCFFLCPTDRMHHSVVLDQRCEQMLMKGLLLETARLAKQMPDMVTKAIGYRQCLDFLSNDVSEASLEQFIHDFCAVTRRYSKKQMSWFRKDDAFVFVPVDNTSKDDSSAADVANKVWNLSHVREIDTHESQATRDLNAEQGKGMKFFLYQPHVLKRGSVEFDQLLQQAQKAKEILGANAANE